MQYPRFRGRRLRRSEAIRRMVRETEVRPDDLMMPFFVVEGEGVREPIVSMPGQARLSVDLLCQEAQRAWELGIPSLMLFGIPPEKDEAGSGAYAIDGVIPRALRALREAVPEMALVADVCMCEYTSHGHCGRLVGDEVLNDPTLEDLAASAVAYAQAGADIVAPSDMMDGRVGAIRTALDGEGFEGVAILSYAAKYASAYYGPFRDAADSAPSRGDRKGYQMDPPNRREALREVRMDVEEGADMVMVKPALVYLDIVREVRDTFDLPVAAYNVSGEYAMVKAAAEKGWIDERRVVVETLTGIKRAGADTLITYHAMDVAEWLA